MTRRASAAALGWIGLVVGLLAGVGLGYIAWGSGDAPLESPSSAGEDLHALVMGSPATATPGPPSERPDESLDYEQIAAKEWFHPRVSPEGDAVTVWFRASPECEHLASVRVETDRRDVVVTLLNGVIEDASSCPAIESLKETTVSLPAGTRKQQIVDGAESG